jgi:hypothetical protein
MDIQIQKRNVWIISGSLAGVGLVIALIKTWKWFTRSGKEIIDLPVRINIFSILFN